MCVHFARGREKYASSNGASHVTSFSCPFPLIIRMRTGRADDEDEQVAQSMPGSVQRLSIPPEQAEPPIDTAIFLRYTDPRSNAFTSVFPRQPVRPLNTTLLHASSSDLVTLTPNDPLPVQSRCNLPSSPALEHPPRPPASAYKTNHPSATSGHVQLGSGDDRVSEDLLRMYFAWQAPQHMPVSESLFRRENLDDYQADSRR